MFPIWPIEINRNSFQAVDLIACYPVFAQPRGRVLYDVSGYQNHAPLGSANTWGGVKNIPMSISGDGTSSSVISAPDNALLDQFKSVSFWVYHTLADFAFGGICSKNAVTSNTGITIRREGTTVKVYVANVASTAFSFATGIWGHIAVTNIQTTTAYVYFNGGYVGSIAGDFNDSASYPFSIGSSYYLSARYLPSTVRLADFRIYKTVLTQAQVYSMYHPATRFDLFADVRRRWFYVPVAAATEYTQGVSGAGTPAGAISKQTGKRVGAF